jgi:hypothetical protein
LINCQKHFISLHPEFTVSLNVPLRPHPFFSSVISQPQVFCSSPFLPFASLLLTFAFSSSLAEFVSSQYPLPLESHYHFSNLPANLLVLSMLRDLFTEVEKSCGLAFEFE